MAIGKFPFPKMNGVKGLRLGTASANIRYTDRDDLLVVEIQQGAAVAGVFTQNAFCAAPVTACKNHLPGAIRYLVVNSGNANACTGAQGLADANLSCAKLAELGKVESNQVLPFSTGVIGELMPMDKLIAAMPAALENLAEDNWKSAARAIMTTDTRPKGSSVQITLGDDSVAVTGIAKGSGMIKPDMATMLAYIATDAKVEPELLQEMLLDSTNASFNRITVDGDTSTNDSCILIATGAASSDVISSKEDPRYALLFDAVKTIHIELAQSIIGDGEGATKFITINVSGGKTAQECVAVAYAIAQSPLVKTAFFASDANWGRIVAAIGYAGVDQLDDSKVTVHLDDVLIVENGGRAESYAEADGQKIMNQDNIEINIDLNRGENHERVWTTDLSHDYVTINADYRS